MTNDVPYDQRMRKIATSLDRFGYRVLLIGVHKFNLPTPDRPYDQKRIHCWFKKGKLFYLECNLRLFFYLCFSVSAKVYSAVDTDALLGITMAAALRRKPLVYDAHEYFIQLEEIMKRPVTKTIWKWVEDICIPRVNAAYTISEGYAELFAKRFELPFFIVENATELEEKADLTKERSYILYQGAVNFGRGLEELIEAMPYIEYPLVICGKGDAYGLLVRKVKELGLENKVTFKGYVAPAALKQITQQAKIGLTLFSNEGLSNHHSLCNRFFDYMHAGVPQLAMNYPEYRLFNERFKVSYLLEELSAEAIASAVNTLLLDELMYRSLANVALKARVEVNWQAKERVLKDIYKSLVKSDGVK